MISAGASGFCMGSRRALAQAVSWRLSVPAFIKKSQSPVPALGRAMGHMSSAEPLLAKKSPAPYARIPGKYFERAPIEETVATPEEANAVFRAGLILPIRDDHPDFPTLLMGNYLLDGTSSGRLPARVREEEGLSYSTYSQFQAGPIDAAGSFDICAIYAPRNRERVEKAIREELERAMAQVFTDAEVAAAKKGFLEARQVQRG